MTNRTFCRPDQSQMQLEGFVIVPPISPWDEKHRAAIELEHAKQTLGTTAVEAWARHCRRGLDSLDSREFSHRVQYYFERGYRLRKAVLLLEKQEEFAKNV